MVRGASVSGLSALAQQVAAKTQVLTGAIHDHVVVTPLIGLAAAAGACGAEVLLKCEHQQKTGSFKVCGALAKLLSLSDDQRDRGVIAASTGNHGLGVACALSALGGRRRRVHFRSRCRCQIGAAGCQGHRCVLGERRRRPRVRRTSQLSCATTAGALQR
jgi:Pyridoxal-phosphate dependent enzyme